MYNYCWWVWRIACRTVRAPGGGWKPDKLTWCCCFPYSGPEHMQSYSCHTSYSADERFHSLLARVDNFHEFVTYFCWTASEEGESIGFAIDCELISMLLRFSQTWPPVLHPAIGSLTGYMTKARSFCCLLQAYRAPCSVLILFRWIFLALE